MKRNTTLAALACLMAVPFWNSPAQTPCSDEERCQLVVQALQAVARLKPDMHRIDLAQDFQPDGGITPLKQEGEGSYLDHARYVYRKCPYVKVDVDMVIEGATKGPVPTPLDRIAKVSRPYLEYPFMD